MSYEYDGEDRLSRVFDAKGNMTQLGYDAKGRVVTITDPLGNSRQIKYDEVDNVLQRFDALGKVIASFGYDATHMVTSQRDALNQQTRFEYDNLGRLTQTTDPLNRVTQFAYDALNRLTHSLDALQGISQQGFDADGNRTDLIDPNGNETQFDFDRDGRLIQEKVATGNSINYQYNSRDLLAQVINGRGQQRAFEYDAANRLVTMTDIDGTTSFTYDNNGNVLTVTDREGTITRQYDALDRVTSYTDVNGNTIQYEYDVVGNLTTLIYPDGKRVGYEYNALNQLVQVIDWAGRFTRYEYDENGRLIKTLRPNETQQLRNYNVKGQLLQQRDVTLDQTPITQFDYRYDAVGNIIEETKQPANVVPNLQLEMTYAPANQLATVNQQAVELDADGNMVNGMLKDQLTSFSFDSRNRLIQAGDTTYRYDAENHRIGVNQTQFVVNPKPALSQVLVKTENGQSTYYVYGLGLIGEETSGEYITYHFDYRGSTVALTNAIGQVVDRVAYSAYGELLTQPTHDTPFLFNGMYGVMSDDNGLYYMRARFYNPEIKRFINQDVLIGNIAGGQSLNRFAYVTGNPISLIDPFGLAPDIGVYWENYDNDAQGIIEDSGGNITQFLGQNTCAIRLSNMFNKSGEPIPLPEDLPRKIRAVSSKNGGNFIYSSIDMGMYLDSKFGQPNLVTDIITADNYKEIAAQLSGKQGLVHLIAGDSNEYGASGHVDLIGPQGPRTVLKGSMSELEAYFLRNKNAQLKIRFWHLDGNVPDERGFWEWLWDPIAELCGCL